MKTEKTEEVEGVENLYKEKEVDVIPQFGACGGGDDDDQLNQINSSMPSNVKKQNLPRLTDSDIKQIGKSDISVNSDANA